MTDDFELTSVQTESERLDASMRRAKVDGTIIQIDADKNIEKLCKSNKNKQLQLKISTFFKPKTKKTTKKKKNRSSHPIIKKKKRKIAPYERPLGTAE